MGKVSALDLPRGGKRVGLGSTRKLCGGFSGTQGDKGRNAKGDGHRNV